MTIRMKEEKGSASFHRGFGLVRSAVSSVLALVNEGKNRKEVKEELALGPDQFTAAVNYCERSGLINQAGISDFGQAALANDPTLANLTTQWVMHYYLSAPRRYSPNYWAFLTTDFLGTPEVLSTTALGKVVVSFAKETSGQELKERTGETGATGFVSTYAQEEGLGALGFLEAKGGGQYQVTSPQPLPAAAFACILADYWPILAPQGEATVELAAITRGELAQVLHQSEAQLNALLAELATPSAGLIQRQRLYTPYTVTRQRLDAATAWDQLYA
ncbi:DUF4007 family protein [Hymenobacter glacialis]|uniref:DUF4007 family protein n=1 Tax=Hymenobacter glacialis TaxID=1908236 RepID=UPI0013015FFC|nr:DUF4007 family protein [Hymenobacter glacialis]